MTTISLWARGDGANANNAELNVDNLVQQPTVEITFDSGANGDVLLDYNGGNEDPDTTVTINGTSYNFTVELTGGLPLGNNKVPDQFEGLDVTVISVDIGGTITRLWFVNDGSASEADMDDFGNGAIPLTDVDYMPPPVLICFCAGTLIATPTGQCRVEDLVAGDMVLTHNGAHRPVLWVGCTTVPHHIAIEHPELQPIRILAGAIAPGVPSSDLDVSAQHRVVLESAGAALMFHAETVLVPAKHLVGSMAQRVIPDTDVAYYHVLLRDHDILISNGLPSESFQPAQRTMDGLDVAAKDALLGVLANHDLTGIYDRPGGMPSLKRHEAAVLVDWIGVPDSAELGAS